MRKTFAAMVAIMLSAIASPCVAQDNSEWESRHEICSERAKIGELIMELRQLGRPMADVMKGAIGDSFTETLVVVAYGEPRFQTKEAQQRQITEFHNATYKSCYEKLLEQIQKHK